MSTSIFPEDVSDFVAAASQAKKQGKKEFKFGDKTFPVTVGSEVANTVVEMAKGTVLVKNVKDNSFMSDILKMAKKMKAIVTDQPRKNGFLVKGTKDQLKDIFKFAYDNLKGNSKPAEVLAMGEEKDFEPHMMYDPKTGKGYEAKTHDDHVRMSKLGYVHDKDEIGAIEEKKRVYRVTSNKLQGNVHAKDEKEAEKIFRKKGAKGKITIQDMGVYKGQPTFEGKSSTGYELYHKDFSSAMKHAYDFAKKKLKIEIDPEEIDSKVATGPRKPSKGKTNSYRLMGKDGKKGVQIQVYNTGNSYELNMYKEETELDEAIPKSTQYALVQNGKIVAKGSKRDMVSKKKKEGGKIYNSPGSKVGDTMKEAYKPVKANHYDVKIQGVKKKDVNAILKYIKVDGGNYDIEDVDADQVTGGGMSSTSDGDIFIQGDDAGKLGMEIAKKFRGVKVMGEEIDEKFILNREMVKILNELKEPFIVYDTADKNKIVATASDEKGAKSSIATAELPPIKVKDKKTLRIVKTKKKQMIGQPLNASHCYKEEELFISLLNSGVLTEKVDPNKLVKVFDKLKTKDVIQLKVDSSISKGKGLQPYVVKSKNKLKNGVEKIALILQGNPTGVKRFMYKRDGRVTFAIGDMGASIADFKEETVMDIQQIQEVKRDIDPADVDNDATAADKEAAKMNIIMQIRKAIDVKGNHKIKFADGKSKKVDLKFLNYALQRFDKMKPRSKEKFQNAMSKSYRDMLKTLKDFKEAVSPAQQAAIAISKKEKEKKEEELSAKQKKIDLNKNGKIDGDDLAKLRKKKNEETVIGIEIDEAKSVIPQLKTIVKDKQHAKIKGVTVDLFTASMITQIYDKVNDANKKKMDGLALPKLVDIAHKMMKRESVVLEGYERTVMDTLQDAGLEYDAYFADGKLYVSKDKVKQVKSALEDNDDIRKLPKMVKETIELIEAKTQQAAVKEFDKMIKSGSVDTADFKKAKAAYMKGDLKKLGKIAWNIDTDPSERILANINQNDPATFMKMYPNAEVGDYLRSIAFAHRKMYESDEITEAKFTAKEIKMAIGIASDPRYKGGNYTGASKAIEKIKKGLSNHKQVAAVLKRQNEEAILEIIAESDKSDAKEMAELVKEIEPKLKTNELKKRVFDLAMEKYKNKSRANKIASHIK